MARLRPRLVLATSLALASLTLAGCGAGDAVAQARTACTYVHRALVLQHKSELPGVSAAQRDRLQSRAMGELLAGTKYAAAATSADGRWNALMTQINEAERVSLDQLAPSLKRLCRVANSSTPYL